MIKTTASTRQVIVDCTQRISNKSGNAYLQVRTHDAAYNVNDFLDRDIQHADIYVPGVQLELVIRIAVNRQYTSIEIVDAMPIDSIG